MTEDLRDVLGAAAGTPGDRPELSGLWATGRRRRRNGRLARGGIAVVAVIGVAVGAVALAAGDDGQDVVAGPTDRPADAPPPEPTDTEVGVEVEAGPIVDGLPTAEPGQVMTLTYRSPGPYGPGRNGVVRWERWDGTGWVPERQLVVERVDEPGSGQVFGMDVAVGSGELRFPTEVDRYPTPDDLDAGWYRVCVPMIEFSGRGPTIPGSPVPPVTTGTTVPGPTTTTAPSAPGGLGGSHEPCAQLRGPGATPSADSSTSTSEPEDAGPTTTASGEARPDGPPPAEPTLAELTLRPVGDQPYPAGGMFVVQVSRAGGVTLGFETTWEQWDGTDWVRTHLVLGAPYDGVEPGLASYLGDSEPIIQPGTFRSGSDLTNVGVTIPPLAELTSPWSRVCINAAPDGLGRPCVQVDVDGAGGRPLTVHGEEARWTTDPAAPPTSGATAVTILVTRTGCSGGTTGDLLEPQVDPRPDAVVITVDAAPQSGMHTCPGNDAVPVTVDLGGPIGDRALVDGWCAADAGGTVSCEGYGEVRWSP